MKLLKQALLGHKTDPYSVTGPDQEPVLNGDDGLVKILNQE
jgi:hypothetical protein